MIKEIIRDSTLNIARRTLFPFNRISQKSVTFKLTHSQLIETILLAIGHENAKVTSHFLLEQAKELVASPPSEDQRNQQCTSAEIFGGVSRALIQYSTTDEERSEIWEKMLLPFLDEAVVKMPVNLVGAFFGEFGVIDHKSKYDEARASVLTSLVRHHRCMSLRHSSLPTIIFLPTSEVVCC